MAWFAILWSLIGFAGLVIADTDRQYAAASTAVVIGQVWWAAISILNEMRKESPMPDPHPFLHPDPAAPPQLRVTDLDAKPENLPHLLDALWRALDAVEDADNDGPAQDEAWRRVMTWRRKIKEAMGDGK